MGVAETSTVRPRPERRRWVAALGWAGGALLGAVLLVAALAKALDPAAFAEEIAALGLAGPLPPLGLAVAVLGLETALGAALVVNLRRLPILVTASLLVLAFLAITGRTAWRVAQGLDDAGAGCGCFGNLVDRTPAEALRQDLLMLVPTLALAWLGRPGARGRIRLRTAGAITAGLLTAGFAAAAPGLPLDDLATRLRPGTELGGICAGRDAERVCLGDLAPGLASGAHLVVLADVDAEGFEEIAGALNAWARSGGEPPVTLLAEIAPDRRQQLLWTIGPAFELQDAPRAMLRPLHRALPRSFRVEEGIVTETWAGLPPAVASNREETIHEDPNA